MAWTHSRKLQVEWDGAIVTIEFKAELFDDEMPDSDMGKQYAEFVADIADRVNDFGEEMLDLYPFPEDEEEPTKK